MTPDLSRDVMAWTAGVLLAVYVLAFLAVLTFDSRQHDPQRGQAVGCLMIVVFVLLGFGAVLAAGVYWDVGFLIYAVFCVTVFPAVSLAGSAVWHVTQKLRGREW